MLHGTRHTQPCPPAIQFFGQALSVFRAGECPYTIEILLLLQLIELLVTRALAHLATVSPDLAGWFAERDALMDRRLADTPYLAGDYYTIADIAAWCWHGNVALGQFYGNAAEFLALHDYSNVQRWVADIAARPAVKREES